jgi:hypothetical protein
MQKMRLRKNVRAILMLCSMSTIFYFGCKKNDTSSDVQKKDLQNLTNDFFKIPPNTSPLVTRVIENIINRNNKKEFVTNFAQENGFPVWNKPVIIQKTNPSNINSLTGNNVANSTDTVIYIPLVLQNGTVTNGFITASINDSISLSYSLSKDYKNYPFDNTTTNEGATQFSSFLMLLDHEVFGHSDFEITDRRLFNFQSSHPRNLKVKIKLKNIETNNTQNNNLMAGTTTSICWIAQTTASASGTCTCGSGGCWCWNDPNRAGNGCCSNQVCINITLGTGNEPPGWPSGGGGGGGTSNGSSGGGQIPHIYPCIPGPVNPNFTNNSLTGDPLPPCPPPSGGTGWTPAPNPCEVINSLMLTNNFPLFYTNLRSNCTNNFESAYMFTEPPTLDYSITNGTPNELKAAVFPSTPISGFVHNHYIDSTSLSVFSSDDFYNFFDIFRNHKMQNVSNFTYGMVSNNTSYILMITDSLAFKNFGDALLAPGMESMFNYTFYEGFDIHEDSTNAANERHMLQALTSVGAGLKMFKANANLTGFTPIKMDSDNQNVITAPCIN